MYRYPNAVLLVFCKAPVAGQVKTRLSNVLSAQQCADLHTELSLRTLELAVNSQLCPVQLWCSPTIEQDFFSLAATTYGISLAQQQGKDLGERMHHAFCSALVHYRHAVLIGCDCPSLTKSDLATALDALAIGNDIVLAPAEDGGYVLVGLNQPHPELFNGIAWGTSEVLAKTRELIQQHHWQSIELKEQWDVDTPTDLLRYYQRFSPALWDENYSEACFLP